MSAATDGTARLLELRRVLSASEPGRRAVVDALFRREESVDEARLADVLGPHERDGLETLGLVEARDGRVRATARIDRVGHLLAASDLRSRRREPAFVVGPGPATTVLARFVRPGGGRLLDLGSGSGALGLLVRGTASIVAVDLNPRAVAFTRFNGALNGVPIDARAGDFLHAPERAWSGRFDTVVANPPFVLAPAHRLTYRDRSLPRDEVGRRTLEALAAALAPGGRGFLLCNWIASPDAAWAATARTWCGDLGLDAIALRLGDQDPSEYARQWTRDLPPPQAAAEAAAWDLALRAEGVLRIVTGVLAVRRPQRRHGRLAAPRFDERDPRAAPVDAGWVEGGTRGLRSPAA